MSRLAFHPSSRVALLLAVAGLAACGDSMATTTEPRALRPAFNTAPTGTDLQISGSSDKGSPTGGTYFNYTFQVKWASGAQATNVVFTDTLPYGVSLNYVTVNGFDGIFLGICAQNGAVVTCSLGTMDKTVWPSQYTVGLNVIAPPTVGSFSNTGIVTSDTPDTQPANNHSTVTVQVKVALGACPQLPPGQPTFEGIMGGGIPSPFNTRVAEQFALFAINGTTYWVMTNYVGLDPTQPVTQVINFNCKGTPATFAIGGNYLNVTGIVDGTTFTWAGVTYPVLHASVVQVFTLKDAG